MLVERVGRNSKFLDHYRWVLSSITYNRIRDKRFSRDSYIPLNKEVLRSVISKRKETRIIADLCSWGFIEQHRSWQVGVRSMGYRLKEPFNVAKTKAFPLSDKGMNKRLAQFGRRSRSRVQAIGAGYAITHDWLFHLRIDQSRAMKFIRRTYDLHGDKYQARLISIDLLAHGQIFFTVDGKAGRAHHNLSNLPGDLRRFLSINGHPLVQVDISNSQPLFLYLTLSSDRTIDRLESEYMRQLVTTGTFYDELKPPEMTRDEFKKEIFQVFYGRGSFVTDTTSLFNDRFPSIAKAIAQAKVPDHAKLAIAMQAVEARVIFKAVERFANATASQAPILTIHDSLVTLPEHVALAKQELHGVFKEEYGLVPPTKTKAA